MCASTADSFVLVRQVGEGGFGTVHEARDGRDGSTVAVKVLHALGADAERRFEREASLLSGLAHPNIVRYLGHGRTTDNLAYVAMEWLEGETLATRLRRGALSLEDTLLCGRCVVAGLGQAQLLRVVHRDLKPANLFLLGGQPAETKILDFGLARRLDDAGALTALGAAVGTPHYMSPEQARGELNVELASDVFSLGCVLYECLTGVRAFGLDDPLAVLMAICVDEPPRLESLQPSVPPAVARLVHAMLSKAPSSRPALTVLSRELDALLARSRVETSAASQAPALHASSAAHSLAASTEQRVLSALFIGHAGTSQSALDVMLQEKLDTHLPAYGVRGDRLADGSRLLLLDASTTAGEQVLVAARLALALRETVSVPMVLCTGRAEVGHRRPLGELIERGARWLSDAHGPDITLDDASAALLTTRFEIAERHGVNTLVGERAGDEAPRTLLGQVTPFVGRERDLGRLVDICQDAIEDRAANVGLVVGRAGAGKSRLKYELVQRLRTAVPTLRLLSAQADSLRSSTPFSVLTSALHAWADVHSHDAVSVRQHKLAARVQGVVPQERAGLVTAFLGEMIGVPFADEAHPALRAARRDPQVMADRQLSNFLAWLEALAAEGPLAILVEDLHWADAPSVRFLDAALSALAERSFVVLAFARPEVRATFPALWSERGLVEVSLPKLSAQACTQLLESIGHADLSVSTQRWMIERAEGNPFFLEELVRSVRGHTADRESLPDTILGIIQARFDALGEGAKRIVRAASVFGEGCDVAALKALLGGPIAVFDFDGWLRLLTEREVLVARGEGDARQYVFRHALMRDAAYALITGEERTLGHRLAGEWLEQHGRAEPSVLANHFELGEVPERAAFWYCAATTAAFEADALPEVVRCGQGAVRFGVQGERLAEMAALVAEALSYGGQHAEAVEWAARAKAQAVPGAAAWWRARQVLVASHLSLGAQEGAAQAIDEMTAQVPGRAPPPEAGVALACAATNALIYKLGASGTRILSVLEALPMGELSGRARGFQHGAVGFEAAALSPERAIHELGQSVAQFRSAGSLKDVLRMLGNLAWSLIEAGLLDEAEVQLREAVALADTLGLRGDVASTLTYLGLVHIGRRQPDLAEQTLREALGIYARLQEASSQSLCLALLAHVLARRVCLDEASELVQQARMLSLTTPTHHAVALAVSAEVERQRGQADAALAWARAAMALHQEHSLSDHVALVWLALIEALLAAGEVDEARTRLSEAMAWLTSRLDTIEDPVRRQAFLTQVPDHAQLVALEQRWV